MLFPSSTCVKSSGGRSGLSPTLACAFVGDCGACSCFSNFMGSCTEQGNVCFSYDRLADDETCHATSLSWKYDVTQAAHCGGMSFGSNLGPTSGSDFGLYGRLRSFMPACSGVRLALRLLHG